MYRFSDLIKRWSKHWALKLCLPFLMGSAVLGISALFGGASFKAALLALSYAFTPAGRFALLSAPFFGIPVSLAVASFLFMDFLTCIFIIWNFDLSKKIPFIGRIILILEKRAHTHLKKKRDVWVEGVEFFGIMTFVILPFWVTNAALGTIIGHIAGMKESHLLAAVLLGSFLGILMLAGPTWLLARLF